MTLIHYFFPLGWGVGGSWLSFVIEILSEEIIWLQQKMSYHKKIRGAYCSLFFETLPPPHKFGFYFLPQNHFKTSCYVIFKKIERIMIYLCLVMSRMALICKTRSRLEKCFVDR